MIKSFNQKNDLIIFLEVTMPGIVLESEQITENLCTCGACILVGGRQRKSNTKKIL